MRPWTHIPRFFANGANDQDVPNAQDRIAAQYVMTAGSWVSESRFGWNLVDLDRWDAFFRVMDPNPGAPPEVSAFGRRVPWINITNLFSGPDAEIFNLHNHTWSYDQKVSRGDRSSSPEDGIPLDAELRQQADSPESAVPISVAVRCAGEHSDCPSTPRSGRPTTTPCSMSSADSFRMTGDLGANLVLNLGVRYDYYLPIVVKPTTDVPAEAVNLAPATDLRKLDFGPQIDPLSPYDAGSAIAPRLGFAWTVPGTSETVVRGGVGYLYSPHTQATVRQITGEPYVSFRQIWNRTDAAAKGLKFPNYNGPLRDLVIADGAREKSHLFGDRRAHRCALHDSIDVERPACARPHARGGNRVHPHERPGLPAAAEFALARDRVNRCDAQRRAARRAGRVLRGQQPDDGLQRIADFGAQAVFEPLLVRCQLHLQQGRWRRKGATWPSTRSRTSTTPRISGIRSSIGDRWSTISATV